MKLAGLKINFLGDSITEAHGASSTNMAFHQVLKKNAGLAEARNYGIGGTRIARQRTPSQNERWDLYFIPRVAEMAPDADAIVVFGGTNDFGHGDAPLGTFDDRTPDTFYGACHLLMTALLERYPESRIVFMTPLHRLNEDRPTADGAPSAVPTDHLETYVNAITEVAAYYALPVLDLFRCSGIQPNVPIIREMYCPDGLHPNDRGHALLASLLQGFLEKL